MTGMGEVDVDAGLIESSHCKKECEPKCSESGYDDHFFLALRQNPLALLSAMVFHYEEDEDAEHQHRHRCLCEMDHLDGMGHEFHDDMSQHQSHDGFEDVSERMVCEQRHRARECSSGKWWRSEPISVCVRAFCHEAEAPWPRGTQGTIASIFDLIWYIGNK